MHKIGMIDLLLKHGARDLDCKALYVAVQSKDDIITAKLLALKGHLDPENKINKKAGSQNESRGFAALSQVFPTNSVSFSFFKMNLRKRFGEKPFFFLFFFYR